MKTISNTAEIKRVTRFIKEIDRLFNNLEMTQKKLRIARLNAESVLSLLSPKSISYKRDKIFPMKKKIKRKTYK